VSALAICHKSRRDPRQELHVAIGAISPLPANVGLLIVFAPNRTEATSSGGCPRLGHQRIRRAGTTEQREDQTDRLLHLLVGVERQRRNRPWC
jgi:hypothetical protein